MIFRIFGQHYNEVFMSFNEKIPVRYILPGIFV